MPSEFIQWFPGHMTKAIRMMKEEIKPVDCVIYVLDARIPRSSVNPSFDEIISGKPRLYVLNKSDLVPQFALNKWVEYFSSLPNSACITSISTKNSDGKLISLLKELNKEKIDRYKSRGIKKTIRAMVIGIPNCGKSTLINSLIGKKKAVTGNKPGVTRGKQWVSVDPYVEVLDTPGTLFPDFSDQNKALHLAFVGSVRDEIVDLTFLSQQLLDFLSEKYPAELHLKYGDVKTLDDIAKKRGFFLKGGIIDTERASKSLINDFRKQAFGKIILEKVDE